MSIKVRFFASLAETVGCREAALAAADGLTVMQVWTRVTGKPALPDGVLCAVNQAYASPESVVVAGDEVAYFPPVTGG